ncbi:GL23859 [Drosophila persimilis]|uniref:Large ribosomal subunit protein uL11m n=2 Tax=pseudoobscura subgroup TaxID=32358 RepID=A0A6I8UNH9_DROPS|nr:39S ribosomal protein L11, mitochondrial [Drosophila pseudoobscura]XP_002012936.1 39S ribosomal protein L11, mitochondrial [Drosophila persimilis]XP_017144746.1 39S ribosomal protein L11, mitochondrial [Drosophila miranda]EDW23922.1 GL23859 [Drosophila persimilis]
MSKAAGKLKSLKKTVERVTHTSKLKTNIPAGMAAAGPPLGPMLGQRAINIAAFCKDFNTKTAEMIEGVPLPCRISVNSDRSYDLAIHHPPATFFLKQAAGIQRGTMTPGKEVAGMITLKHLYEIAAIKIQDPPNALLSMQQMCEMLISIARTCGIKVVRDLDPAAYGEFLEERKTIVEQQRRELQEKREAKMLRTG